MFLMQLLFSSGLFLGMNLLNIAFLSVLMVQFYREQDYSQYSGFLVHTLAQTLQIAHVHSIQGETKSLTANKHPT